MKQGSVAPDVRLKQQAAHLKLHLLSEGVSFSTAFLRQFAEDQSAMEKRRAYNDSDDRHLDRKRRIPQELTIAGLVIAVNHKRDSRWSLDFDGSGYRLLNSDDVDLDIGFPARPRFLEHATASGLSCRRIANLYGGASLAFFSPSSCHYFEIGHECHFCSLKPNRDRQNQFVHRVTPRMATEVLETALALDKQLLKQIMLVGGNHADYDTGFRRHLEIIKALDQSQQKMSVEERLEVHIATMPPKTLAYLKELNDLNARITMNLEVFDKAIFDRICPGKANHFGRIALNNALDFAARTIDGNRVHSILIAGLEPAQSTIAGIHNLVSRGITPIINVFHNDRGSHLEAHERPSYGTLLEIALVLQDVYQKYRLTPYWNGCGRNSLDFEALHGWFT